MLEHHRGAGAWSGWDLVQYDWGQRQGASRARRPGRPGAMTRVRALSAWLWRAAVGRRRSGAPG
jgi:hypothetical protein